MSKTKKKIDALMKRIGKLTEKLKKLRSSGSKKKKKKKPAKTSKKKTPKKKRVSKSRAIAAGPAQNGSDVPTV